MSCLLHSFGVGLLHVNVIEPLDKLEGKRKGEQKARKGGRYGEKKTHGEEERVQTRGADTVQQCDR